jgi:hypothetical protein
VSERAARELLIGAMGRGGAFFFYAGICVVFLFCEALVPETKGKHLEDIQAVFRARVARRGA